MKKSILFLFLALAFVLPAAAARPNILYFYVDDMGWGSIGPNGQAERKAKGLPFVRTPNLDKLAAEGVNFTRAYGCTVCSPARSSQQTGFHQGHTFADRNDPNNAKKAMRADDVTMGDALSAAGYATGYWGKWGYGGSKDMANPTLDNIQTLPTSHGYQHVLAELHHVRAHTFFQPTLWSAPAAAGAKGGLELKPNTMASYAGNRKYPNEPALQNHPNYPKTGYCDDAYAMAALDFVRMQARKYNADGQPFFGLFAAQIPHAPFKEIEQLPKWGQAYADDKFFSALADQSKEWAAMVTRIDAHFGNILAVLEDPDGDGDKSDSVSENTLVIFMSDNGGPGGKNNVELDANGGLRGNKGSIFEGGIRVPMIMRWPAKITASTKLRAGSSSDHVMDVSDLLPTFCELAEVDPPCGIDGVSLVPFLTGSGERRSREFLIHEAGKAQSIIRGKHKLIRSKGELALYDLAADHGEENDIAGSNKKLVKELEALLLGERVDEPRGFANTYHRWTGGAGVEISDPGNWSDYVYENAGTTYMTDDGAPRLSWNAVMESSGKEPALVIADADVDFLSLEIRGGKGTFPMELGLRKGTRLTGRNEVRVGSKGILAVNGGTVASLRWIDVQEGGLLHGPGTVEASVYNAGYLSTARDSAERPRSGELKIEGDYHEAPGSTFVAIMRKGERGSIAVSGTATLAGELVVSTRDFALKAGEDYPILYAGRIEGKFGNRDDVVVAKDGTRYRIAYSPKVVTLSTIP